MSELIELCGMWKSKTGRSIASGKLGYSSKLILVENDKKGHEKGPDYKLLIAKIQEPKTGQNGLSQ